MTLLVGLALGLGLLLTVSPKLWPATAGSSAAHRGRRSTLSINLAHAGFTRLAPSTVIAVSVFCGVAAGAVVFAVLPIVAIAIAASLGVAALPAVVIAVRARARRASASNMWPDVVDQLVSAVRSGLSLPDAISALAATGPALAREPFAQFATEYAASANFGQSVAALKERLADPVADRILETLRMSREVGGSELTTVLRNLAAWLRQESAIRSEVQARQSWVVNAARLGVAAPWVVLLMLSSRPEAVAAYNTPAGVVLIVGGLGVSVVAYRVMIAIGRIPQERRWFE
jgi:tight adherence protein B